MTEANADGGYTNAGLGLDLFRPGEDYESREVRQKEDQFGTGWMCAYLWRKIGTFWT